jgi:hypothetical protein
MLGLNRTDADSESTLGICYRSGFKVSEPLDFGTPVTHAASEIAEPGNIVNWQTPDPAYFGSPVVWLVNPEHFGNIVLNG